MLKKLPQLIAAADEQIRIAVHVDDEIDGLEQNGVLGVGVLHLLGLGRLLGFVQNSLQALG